MRKPHAVAFSRWIQRSSFEYYSREGKKVTRKTGASSLRGGEEIDEM
jgi:hypothetical protein